MALRINTNVASLYTHKNMILNDSKLTTSLERLSSGLRINKAADDSSGMAISDTLKAQYLGIGQAIRNANDGISIVQTADGALQESINIMNTIKTKAIQAASDVQTTATRRMIQNDIDKLMEELDTIARTTSFGGKKLLSGSFSNQSIQIGDSANVTADISIGSADSTKIGHISQSNMYLANGNGGDIQLNIKSSITGDNITLSKMELLKDNSYKNSLGAVASEINRYSSMTGISADAIVSTTTNSPVQAGTTGSDFAINGATIGAISVLSGDTGGTLISAINALTAVHGISATSKSDGGLKFTSNDGRAINITGNLNGVLGKDAKGLANATGDDFSTFGYIELTQKGVSQFNVVGEGISAVGARLTISADMVTEEDSKIAADSTIKAGSKFTKNSVLGDDVMVESNVTSAENDYILAANSTLYATSTIAKGTRITGNIIIAGATTTAGGDVTTELKKNMIVTRGTNLKKGTILGVGTIYKELELSSAYKLEEDYFVTKDMTLFYNTDTAKNTKIFHGSEVASGSVLGADFKIGVTYAGGEGAALTTSAGAASIKDYYVGGTGGTASAAGGGLLIKAGSMLAKDTRISISTAATGTTYNGPTLYYTATASGTTTKVLSAGDVFSADTIQATAAGTAVMTLLHDHVLSSDLDDTSLQSAATAVEIKAGSILLAGFTSDDATFGTAGSVATITKATMTEDMYLLDTSVIASASTLKAGSILGDDTHVMGNALSSSATDIETTGITKLGAESIIQNASILGTGSTIGGKITLSATTEKLATDMTLASGTILRQDTKLAKGTVLSEDMTLFLGSAATSSTYAAKAGETLTSDLWVTTGSANVNGTPGVELSKQLVIKADSLIAANSILATNEFTTGDVNLTDIVEFRLSDLSVLSQADAQQAITIADAALADLDNTRSKLGSVQNQFSATISNLAVTKTNVMSSESTIRDVDFADEASTFSKLQILAQTSSYALAQANASSQNILTLLQ